MTKIDVYEGDCLDVLAKMSDNSFDSIVTDPPYGISFMNNRWDYDVPSVAIWTQALRVLKPGGYLLSFSATRTYHRMVVNIEDGGFEIRDQLAWAYGSGMPKTMDVGRMVERKSPEITRWRGWGTALKPAFEPICLARKPISGTLTGNVIVHEVGAFNIDACRIPGHNPSKDRRASARRTGNAPSHSGEYTHTINDRTSPERYMEERTSEDLGRFPTNLIGDGSEEVLGVFPDSAKRIIYHAKATKKDRAGSLHPTVKPVGLLAYLIRLITPEEGTVLDPFAGSGTTGEAAAAEWKNAVLIERDPGFAADLRTRFGISPNT